MLRDNVLTVYGLDANSRIACPRAPIPGRRPRQVPRGSRGQGCWQALERVLHDSLNASECLPSKLQSIVLLLTGPFLFLYFNAPLITMLVVVADSPDQLNKASLRESAHQIGALESH
jgi:hypothetical protein